MMLRRSEGARLQASEGPSLLASHAFPCLSLKSGWELHALILPEAFQQVSVLIALEAGWLLL